MGNSRSCCGFDKEYEDIDGIGEIEGDSDQDELEWIFEPRTPLPEECTVRKISEVLPFSNSEIGWELTWDEETELVNVCKPLDCYPWAELGPQDFEYSDTKSCFSKRRNARLKSKFLPEGNPVPTLTPQQSDPCFKVDFDAGPISNTNLSLKRRIARVDVSLDRELEGLLLKPGNAVEVVVDQEMEAKAELSLNDSSEESEDIPLDENNRDMNGNFVSNLDQDEKVNGKPPRKAVNPNADTNLGLEQKSKGALALKDMKNPSGDAKNLDENANLKTNLKPEVGLNSNLSLKPVYANMKINVDPADAAELKTRYKFMKPETDDDNLEDTYVKYFNASKQPDKPILKLSSNLKSYIEPLNAKRVLNLAAKKIGGPFAWVILQRNTYLNRRKGRPGAEGWRFARKEKLLNIEYPPRSKTRKVGFEETVTKIPPKPEFVEKRRLERAQMGSCIRGVSPVTDTM